MLTLLLDELYMWPFANAVHAGVASVMCSYQRVNGSYACQNSKLLNGLLKTELGFQGYVVSDWYATHAGVASVEAGLDLDMPGTTRVRDRVPELDRYTSLFGGNITTMVNNGTLSETRLNDMILRIMTPYYLLRQDQDFPSIDPSTASLNLFSPPATWFRDDWNLTMDAPIRDARDNHAQLIRKYGAASTVLVKNIRGALPLKSPSSIAVLGNDAGDITEGPLNRFLNVEYGTLAVGGGSGAARLTNLVTPLQAIKNRAAQDGTLVESWLNNTFIAGSNVTEFWAARHPEVCLVFLKGWAREVVDRESLDLDWQANQVAENVANSCNNTIVITHSSGVNVLPFADHPNITGILIAHYPGEQSGNSLVDVLYGDTNPSGKLPYTIAYNESDYNAPIVTDIETDGVEDWQSWFDEKLEIDYRYFDAHDIPVRYEFGYGLSYTSFEMSDIKVKQAEGHRNITALPPSEDVVSPGGNRALWDTLYEVQVNVRNIGDLRGSTVAQLYVSLPEDAVQGTPPRQLRGFDKIELSPGQHGLAHFNLMRRDISYWDSVSQEWRIPTGEITISVGFSSRDLAVSANIAPVQ